MQSSRIVQADPPRERLRAAPFVRPGHSEQRAGLRPAERLHQHPVAEPPRLRRNKGAQRQAQRGVPFFERAFQLGRAVGHDQALFRARHRDVEHAQLFRDGLARLFIGDGHVRDRGPAGPCFEIGGQTGGQE